MIKKNIIKANLFQVIICFILGLQYIFIKDLYSHFDNQSFFVLSLRFFISSLFILLYILVKKEKISLSFTLREFFSVLFYPFVSLILQFFAVKLMDTVSISAMLAFTPIINGAVCLFFPEGKNTKTQYLIMGFTSLLAVLFFLVGEKASFSFLGTLFITLSIVARSLSNAIFSSGTKKHPAEFALKQSLVAFVLYFLFSFLFIDRTMLSSLFLKIDFYSVLSILYLGIFASSTVGILNASSLKYLSAASIGIYSDITSLISFLVGCFVGGEEMSLLRAVLFVVILVFAYFYVQEDAKAK